MANKIDYDTLLSMWREQKKEIDRLTEQSNNFEIISKSHKELNGQLRKELEEKNKDFNDLQKKLDDLKKSVDNRLEELRKKGLV